MLHDTPQTYTEQTAKMLQCLNIPIHRIGRVQLLIGIPRFALDPVQSLSKELYPYIAAQCGCRDWRAVERAIREAILYAWDHQDPASWELYFPGIGKPPSNKRFISNLASFLK